MATSSISDLLASLSDTNPVSQKTASAPTPPGNVNSAREDLHAALAAAAPEKTASHQETTSLEKIAQDLSAADHVAAIKEAQIYGAAMMDGLLMRANQYAQTAPPAQKHASYPQQPRQSQQQVFYKTAEEVQFEGAVDGMSHLGELARGAYELGFDKMASLINGANGQG